jgi:hypothetical protein
MKSLNFYRKTIIISLGLSVLISYYIVFVVLYKSQKSYINHEFWFGINSEFVKIIVFFQILALYGFLTSVSSLVSNLPTQGVLSNHLFKILCMFFIGAIVWPFATFYKKHTLVVLSLIITAISSILLLAGSIEDTNPKFHIVLGTFLVSIVTVLADGVLWNANYIYKLKKNDNI